MRLSNIVHCALYIVYRLRFQIAFFGLQLQVAADCIFSLQLQIAQFAFFGLQFSSFMLIYSEKRFFNQIISAIESTSK